MINNLPKSLVEAAKKVLTESQNHIDVDGVQKHRYNSLGQPIHSTDEGIRNFHRWFGDSTTVDIHGRPKVFYHGSGSTNIKEFLPDSGDKESKALQSFRHAKETNQKFGYMNFRSGSFFSEDPKYAGNYATSIMYPVYIKSNNPVSIHQLSGEKKIHNKNKTPDSLIMHDGTGVINEIAVLDPSQVKSSIGNNGNFEPTKNSILESNNIN